MESTAAVRHRRAEAAGAMTRPGTAASPRPRGAELWAGRVAVLEPARPPVIGLIAICFVQHRLFVFLGKEERSIWMVPGGDVNHRLHADSAGRLAAQCCLSIFSWREILR